MSPLRKMVRRIRALVSRRALDAELDEELRLHLDLEVEKLIAGGCTPAEARRRARLAFGPFQQHREATRDARGLRALDDLRRDLRHGARTLARRPGFTAVVLLTLAVGVGGSAAIFGVVNGILLTPLPYPDADRVLTLWQSRADERDDGEVAPGNFLDWRERSRSFADLTAMEPYALDWLSDEGPVHLPAWLVFEGFFESFGTAPLLGRTPRRDEHEAGRGHVVVLGYEVWRRRFAADPTVIGRVLSLDGQPTQIIGVMPRGFAIPSDEVVWAPKVLAGWERQSRTSGFYQVFGRLASGVSAEKAEAELDAIASRLAAEHPGANSGLTIRAVPLPDRLLGGVRPALLILLGAVGLVLAIVVANVASLQLARAASREREFALRGALGAGGARVTRQLLAENVLLAALGAGLGFALAGAALGAIRRLAPPDLPRVIELTADAEVLWFAAALSLLATLTTGVLPARVASRVRLNTSLVDGGRGSVRSRAVGRAQSALVVVQVASSLVLLVGAGLLVQSFLSVMREDRGFRTDGVVTVTVQSWGYYPTPADRAQFVREVNERLAMLPGVHAAGMASTVPLMEGIGAEQAGLVVEGAPLPPAGEGEHRVSFAVVTPGTFAALGMSLLHGRGIEPGDRAEGRRVAVVNEAFVRRHLGGMDPDPLGRRLRLRRSSDDGPGPPLDIVGVVRDVRRSALHQAGEPTVYLAHPQSPTGANAFVVWGAGEPGALIARVKRTIWDINPTIPIYHESSMAAILGRSVQDRSFLLAILGGFAAMALGLAAAGIFGLMSWAASERTREIGVRMAFGARRDQVLRLVLRRGMRLAGAGIGLGLVGAVAGTRLLEGMLYGVTPVDPATFGAAAAVLLSTALLASWYPAWRAAATDPVNALRAE